MLWILLSSLILSSAKKINNNSYFRHTPLTGSGGFAIRQNRN